MVLSKFQRINTDNYDLETVQSNVGKTLDLLTKGALSGGVLLEGIDLTTGAPNLIEHGLGREPQGYIIVKQSGYADVRDLNVALNLKPRLLSLAVTANLTVSLYIF